LRRTCRARLQPYSHQRPRQHDPSSQPNLIGFLDAFKAGIGWGLAVRPGGSGWAPSLTHREDFA